MPRFRFNLEAVLEQRSIVEQQKQRAVAEFEMQRQRSEAAIRDIQQAIAQERSEQRDLLRAGKVLQARSQAAATVRLNSAAQRSVLELSGILVRLQAARAELLEAAKRRKAVELLRERRYEEWRSEQSRREAAAMDELAVIQASRTEDKQ